MPLPHEYSCHCGSSWRLVSASTPSVSVCRGQVPLVLHCALQIKSSRRGWRDFCQLIFRPVYRVLFSGFSKFTTKCYGTNRYGLSFVYLSRDRSKCQELLDATVLNALYMIAKKISGFSKVSSASLHNLCTTKQNEPIFAVFTANGCFR